MLAKFELRAPLDDADREALLGLPYRIQTFDPAKYLVREGSHPSHSTLILSGFAIRHKLSVNGDRQIVSVHVPGDFVDLEGALLSTADHNVQSLTRCELALVPADAIRNLIHAHPMIAHAMWVDTLVDASIHREWVLNVGRRDARSRVADLLCEFARRLEVAGLGGESGYELPMTQEQLADATGLTPVHVNRTLKAWTRRSWSSEASATSASPTGSACGTQPISRCSVKLRRILEIEEEEALLFRIRVRRQPTKEEQAKNQGGRWVREPKLGVPGPFGERPTSPPGHVSFHYGITTVSRGPDGKSIVSDSRGRVSETERTPGDHDEYVARPGAVMTIGPAEYDQYAIRSNIADLSTGKPKSH